MYADFEPYLKDLPTGWTAEPAYSGQVLLLEKEGCGAVSIHMGARTYSLGICVPRTEYKAADGYSGRGWRGRILVDAMAALTAVWEGKKQ